MRGIAQPELVGRPVSPILSPARVGILVSIGVWSARPQKQVRWVTRRVHCQYLSPLWQQLNRAAVPASS